jgi:cytochrome c peroxidase
MGARNRALPRNAPSLLDIKDRKTLFWDGRSTSLEQQVPLPLLNPLEHGVADEQTLLRLLRASPQYVQAFATAFPGETEPVTLKTLSAAIATYERTLVTPESTFDRHLDGTTRETLSPAAQRGWDTFRGPAGCIQCHHVQGTRPAFTDESFHLTPLGLGSRTTARLATLVQRAAKLHQSGDAGTIDRLISEDSDFAELGRFVVTLDPKDIGAFRTPSLRGVALTAPYMHDGSVSTLELAVELELYRQDGLLRRPIALSAREKADLVEFLRVLSPKKATSSPPSAPQ